MFTVFCLQLRSALDTVNAIHTVMASITSRDNYPIRSSVMLSIIASIIVSKWKPPSYDGQEIDRQYKLMVGRGDMFKLYFLFV